MSHFTEIETEYEQKNEKELVAALEKEFGKGHVEVHEKGEALYGWHGDNRSLLNKTSPDYAPPCELIIRRAHVGSASNDIGFQRLPNGKYRAWISDYDKGATASIGRQGQIAMEYGARVAEKQLKADGWSTTRVDEKDGSVTVKTTGRVMVGVGAGGGWGGKQNW